MAEQTEKKPKGRTLHLKMAKPRKEDYEVFIAFMQGLEQILDYQTHPDDSESEEFRRVELGDEEARDWIEQRWRDVSHAWQRIVMAGQVAIDNACDPKLDYLDFKPEIKKAVEMHDEMRLMLDTILKRLDLEHEEQSRTRDTPMFPCAAMREDIRKLLSPTDEEE